MLIQFAVSNFLSFNEKQVLSLEAGKARKHSNRLYIYRRLKLVKCKALFGSNASGKSNLVSALQFVQEMIEDGFPVGFSNKYYRLNEENRMKPSEFELEVVCSNKRFRFGFSVVLNGGSIKNEWLYEITPSGLNRQLYQRSIDNETFIIGDYFKGKEAIAKLKNYGEDSANDHENLFLSIINKYKGKLFSDYPELAILRELFVLFVIKLNISVPESILTGYPYFRDSNLEEIAELLNALGTGVSSLKIIEVSVEAVKRKIPEGLYNKIISNLEKENARVKKESTDEHPSIVARAYKEFYTFEIDPDDNITIRTIEFSHEKESVFFSLYEESDGTARLLDLIEILFRISDNSIYVIDEIDRCLHPAMTAKIIDLFLSMADKRNTQLIITTHESRLLKNDLLRNDEISFMLKTAAGSTIIKSLDKYQLRADKNIYEALFDGTIEAIPQFNEQKISNIMKSQNI